MRINSSRGTDRAYLSLLDNVATFLLTFALVYAIGRFAVRPLVRATLDYRDTEPPLQQGLEESISIGQGVASRSGDNDPDGQS
ncbi:hypothetical protein [Natrinema sp. SYSU A 869]|uniref:hypothetical protein n=1 Tax=Natrinema sp. SYSU A 869 TaxID=2871694 RepID=UPI0021068171|nr:hypothetical protein [Natrinema sp. SYSU A 869]